MFEYDLEHVMSYTVRLNPPEVIGPVSEGLLANFYFAGGEVNVRRFTGSCARWAQTG